MNRSEAQGRAEDERKSQQPLENVKFEDPVLFLINSWPKITEACINTKETQSTEVYSYIVKYCDKRYSV